MQSIVKQKEENVVMLPKVVNYYSCTSRKERVSEEMDNTSVIFLCLCPKSESCQVQQ